MDKIEIWANTLMRISLRVDIACLMLLRVLTIHSTTLWSKVESREAIKNSEANKKESPSVLLTNRVTINYSFNSNKPNTTTIKLLHSEAIIHLFIQFNENSLG